jgi:hypothetical protein
VQSSSRENVCFSVKLTEKPAEVRLEKLWRLKKSFPQSKKFSLGKNLQVSPAKKRRENKDK